MSDTNSVFFNDFSTNIIEAIDNEVGE